MYSVLVLIKGSASKPKLPSYFNLCHISYIYREREKGVLFGKLSGSCQVIATVLTKYYWQLFSLFSAKSTSSD